LSKRQIQKEQTRKQIIAAAFAEFAEKGFAATRTSDIANAANVSHGTVFVHFPTQEALLNAVIEEFGLRVSFRLHELASGNNSLRDILEAHIRGLTEYEQFYTKLVEERTLLPERARNTFILIQSTISFHLSQAAEREIGEGKIMNCPVHLLFNTWMGLIHYYIENSDLFAPGESVLKRCGKELTDHYMRLVSVKES
jgi:AcrR family transcriptional regulator